MKEGKIKVWHIIFLLVVIAVAIFVRVRQHNYDSIVLEIKNEKLTMLVAKTIYQQKKGLGQRETLGEFDGMVFPFSYADKYAFVMKDMRFAIDIVWLLNGEVVDIAPSLQPENLPDNQLTKYYPRKSANLVLELPAGWVKEHDLEIGDKIRLVEE